MPKKPNPLPAQSYLRKRLTYYPDTGLLFWRVRPESDFSTWKSLIRWRSCLAMREAFTATTRHGHKAGQIDGVPYLAHRIIWKIFYGFDPEIIDHIDRDPSNNRIFNLRDVSQGVNMQNTPQAKQSGSGVVGVQRSHKSNRWQARIKVDGYYVRLGTFNTIAEAAAARSAAEERYRRCRRFQKGNGERA